MNNELLAKIFTVIGMIVFIFILYVGIFVIFRPFDDVITVGRPITKALCEAQFKCDSGEYGIGCNHPDGKKRLEAWKDYRGCNNSTKGYTVVSGIDYIKIERCECRVIM